MNKKIFISIFTLIILMLILPSFSMASNNDKIYIKNKASSSGRIIAEVGNKKDIFILETQKNYYKVSYNNLGYIRKENIKNISSFSTKATLKSKGKVVLTLSKNANSVSGSTVLANIKAGQKVTVYNDKYQNWYICGYYTTGYVLKSDIDTTQNVIKEKEPIVDTEQEKEKDPITDTEQEKEVDNSKTVLYNISNTLYEVPNTKNSLIDLISKIKETNIQQGAKTAYNDCCLGFACHYTYLLSSAKSLDEINGNTAIATQRDPNNSHYFGKTMTNICNNNKKVILETIYDNINNGKPCVLQVNGNSNGTSRHYVVAVGYNANVKSKEDLKESDIVILDTFSANLKVLTVQPENNLSKRFMITGYQTGRTGVYGYGYQLYELNV